MTDGPLWVPSPADRARANLTAFIRAVNAERPGEAPPIEDYPDLYEWSIAEPERFWAALWRFFDLVAEPRPDGTLWDSVLVGADRVAPPDPQLGPRWFTGAKLNFADNLLRYRDDRDAIIAWNELGFSRRISSADLHAEVQRVAAALREQGIKPGDRVAALIPNIPEAIIAMLATTSLGAVWSSCSPDFGAQGVIDRFGQIQPRVLFCTASYRYSGKTIDLLPRIRDIVDRIPEIERVVVISEGTSEGELSTVRAAISYETFIAGRSAEAPGENPRFPFDHPLYVMYSSGTTGLPKCMVHGVGGTLLQHLKELVLHSDVTRDDRVFYFTTCGWMMWNWLVSTLAAGAAVVLYDGAPILRGRPILWDMAEQERITVFGTSAKWIALAQKEGLRPIETHDLSALRCILSTGSPLAAHSFDYVYDAIKRDVRLSSVSGGTDLLACFAIGNPIGPVWRGELQVRALGMATEVFGEDGTPLRGVPGELVCTAPFPSMPIAFWNDPDGAKYRAAYFEFYPNVWRHGDWAELTDHDGMIIYGRSDATLNPAGVRIGTAEIYRQVEQLPEVIESLVVGQDLGSGVGADVRIVLFVRLAEGVPLTEELKDKIRTQIRINASPHHVPKKIIAVADIPRTISGKITELAVRDVIHGRPVKNRDALANPAALELFKDLPELRS